VGLEDLDDLIADFDQALGAAGTERDDRASEPETPGDASPQHSLPVSTPA
jgi:hypothetical protein